MKKKRRENKIYIDITGRCGNQFFQYAFARKLSLLNGFSEIMINFYHVNRWKSKTNFSSFCDELSNFNIMHFNRVKDIDNSIIKYGSKKQLRYLKLYEFADKLSNKLKTNYFRQLLQNKMQRLGIYKEDCTSSISPMKTKENNIFVKGYFENNKYFDDIKDLLLREFTPIHPPKEKNKNLYKIIKETESVCLSVRVWDEISSDADLMKKRNVCSNKYYIEAINRIIEIHPNATFIVFSNNIEWVKHNLNFSSYPVYYEDGNDETWEKLRLMYSCKHFIMSTSTFCWWAQYLCRNTNKLIVSPDRWTNDNKSYSLIGQNWIKIKVE